VERMTKLYELPFFEFKSNPNERKANAHHMAKLKKMGLCAGVSDLEFLYDKGLGLSMLYLELKLPKYRNRKNGGLNNNQIKFKQGIDDANLPNVKYRVAYTAFEAIEIIKEYVL